MTYIYRSRRQTMYVPQNPVERRGFVLPIFLLFARIIDMKNNHFKKGFTLIELLVVIAIISILASIVMAQLSASRAKAANVAIKANLVNLRTQASLVFFSNSPNSYDNICADPIFIQGLVQVGTLGGEPAKCFDGNDTWVVVSSLQPSEETYTNWCVDSSDKSEGITQDQSDAITSASTLCP